MLRQDAADERPRRGLAAKHAAITHAARRIFGRDGYAATSIDTVAAEAGVSKRTVYNHFAGKEDLFTSVVQESARLCAEALSEIIERCLDDAADLEADLIALGRAWAGVQADYADHFTLSQRISAEGAHVPAAVRDSWHETGPQRAQNALALRMRLLAERGLLSTDDAALSANHYIWLVLGEITARSHYGTRPLSDTEVTAMVTAGVRAFLYGYLPR
ncbi:TetR/AcrR family transcriptional regulator [Streptomonospora salina]|uniref:AcrR family transcriptional regulator n=1 Tax=Streptomonospora salina TaxID=104205 RepID=A0A841DYM1_9ACTN|nr:TetR/AcrR family transcriptional regulator [Streptomonospora salina]MBB5996547.1 AcrR family transcriptional regulator [Streptomonospora salina]